ncbi:hypothetical protein ABZ471_26645 [Streptomyces sp. NPDC005728]|uniref:hypothetical protein n=1 Tax=Streptomyces sp. NPDC005728 TaxID=3157054 RepID=UPI0033D9D98D
MRARVRDRDPDASGQIFDDHTAAEVLGLAVGAVGARPFRARKRLRSLTEAELRQPRRAAQRPSVAAAVTPPARPRLPRPLPGPARRLVLLAVPLGLVAAVAAGAASTAPRTTAAGLRPPPRNAGKRCGCWTGLGGRRDALARRAGVA